VRFEGSISIQAPRETVWNYLTDAEFVAQCAPGVKRMEVITPNQKYFAVAAVGFGSIVVEFKTSVEFQEMRNPEFAKVRVHGDATDSAAEAVGQMTLLDGADGSTELKWVADIEVVGKITRIASRMMSSLTRTLTAKFFECAKSQIEA